MAKPYHPEAVRADFPALAESAAGVRPVYLDTAATALKPRAVVDAVSHALAQGLGNPGRGVHAFSERATAAYLSARGTVQRFLGAAAHEEIVFTSGTTEAINLVAFGHALPRLSPDDEVIVSELEHHANLLPWQQVCARSGARLRIVPLLQDGQVGLEAIASALGPRTKVVALTHLSNVLGCVLPLSEISERVHAHGAVLVVDGAQAVAHLPVDVQTLGCDFYAFSAHKLYGPDGIGVLWARDEILAEMQPLRWGGGMITQVTSQGCELSLPPARFEAGTPNVSGAIGLAAAIAYLANLDREAIAAYERHLLSLARESLERLSGVRVLGPADGNALLSFVMDRVHAHDLGTVAADAGVAVRTGHHCAQLLMRRLRVPATVRMSLGLYNDERDVEALVDAVVQTQELFS